MRLLLPAVAILLCASPTAGLRGEVRAERRADGRDWVRIPMLVPAATFLPACAAAATAGDVIRVARELRRGRCAPRVRCGRRRRREERRGERLELHRRGRRRARRHGRRARARPAARRVRPRAVRRRVKLPCALPGGRRGSQRRDEARERGVRARARGHGREGGRHRPGRA